MSKKLNRRDFLKVAGGAAAGAALISSPLPKTFAAPAVIQSKTKLTLAHAWDLVFLERQNEFDQIFMEKYPEIEIETINNTWADHNNIIPTWAASNELPDIIYVHGSRAFPFASEGITIDIDDQAKGDEAFNVNGIFEEALNLYKYEGRLYALPYDHGPVLLGYNKDLFDAEGVDYPTEEWTMDDFFEAAMALGGKPMQWGYGGYYNHVLNLSNESLPANIGPWGGKPWAEDESSVDFTSDEVYEALKFWYDMMHVHKVATNQSEASSFPAGVWLSGAAGMFALASWGTPQMSEFANFNWDVAPWPAGPAGKKTGSFGSGYGITRNSEAVDAAWLYLSEYLSKDGMEFMWGTTGRGSPAREEAYQSWIDSENAPESAAYYLDALSNYAVTGSPYQTKGAAEALDILARNRDLLQTGDVTIEEGIELIMEEVNPVLEAAMEE